MVSFKAFGREPFEFELTNHVQGICGQEILDREEDCRTNGINVQQVGRTRDWREEREQSKGEWASKWSSYKSSGVDLGVRTLES